MSGWAQRRFWKAVSVEPSGSGFTIRLDGRDLMTPAKAQLHLPTRALAELVASEWSTQGERIDPASMPATRLANAALDKVPEARDAVIGHILSYGHADLLCYRAEAPVELAKRQAEAWDPFLDWAAETFGARMRTTAGIVPIAQDERSMTALARALESLSDFEVVALQDLVGLSGSLILALAATSSKSDPEALWEVSRLDELWQIAQWGHDDEAERVNALKRNSFLSTTRFARCAQKTT